MASAQALPQQPMYSSDEELPEPRGLSRASTRCKLAAVSGALLCSAGVVAARGGRSARSEPPAGRASQEAIISFGGKNHTKSNEKSKQVDYNGATWVMAEPDQNCKDACWNHGELQCYFDESVWPQSKHDVFHIAKELGHHCEHEVSAENTYDPFFVGSFCSVGPWKPPNMWGPWKPTNIRSCKALPPVATQRFCSCIKEIPFKCNQCKDDCWKDETCCPEGYDKCKPDPLLDTKHPDYDWWGSGANWEWDGVDPNSTWMQGHPKDAKNAVKDLPKFSDASVKGGEDLYIKVLSYNLFWWNLFDKHHGRDGSAGKLVRDSAKKVSYDIMGFQECEDAKWVMGDAEMQDTHEILQADHSVCLAWSKNWTKLADGVAEVATDGGWVKNNKWGDRIAVWVRLEHKKTGNILFFINHHGPLPLNSGGECGGLATAYNILKAIEENAKKDDIIAMVGDFNADYNSLTVKLVASRLTLGYHGESFGGIDNMFANVPVADFVKTDNLGNGSSDHDAISATFVVRAPPTTTSTSATTMIEKNKSWEVDSSVNATHIQMASTQVADDNARGLESEPSAWSSWWPFR